MFRRVYGPKLFEADGVVLGAAVCIEIEFVDELFAQVSAAALGENGVFAEQFVARSEAAFMFSILADAHVAGRNTSYGAVFIVQNFRSSKAGKNVHTHIFGLLAEPTAQVRQTDGVVAFIVRVTGNEKAGYLDPIGVVDHVVDQVFGDRIVEWRATFCPVWKQFVQCGGFKMAPDRMCAPISEPFSTRQTESSWPLLSPVASTGKPPLGRWPTSDNDHVKFHGFALYWLFHCFVIPLFPKYSSRLMRIESLPMV